MSALEFERELARRPGARGRIPAARGAARRDPPRTPRARRRRRRSPTASPRLTAPAAPPSVAASRRSGVRLERARALALAASFAVLGFAVGAGLTSLRMQSASQGVAESLVSDFARAEIAGQPFDVASSDRHTVKPWLAGRTTVSASIVDLAQRGLSARGRPRRGRRPDSRADARLPPQRAPGRRHRTAARRPGRARRGGDRDDRRLPRRALVGREPRLTSRSPTWTKRRSPNSSRRSGRRRSRRRRRSGRECDGLKRLINS